MALKQKLTQEEFDALPEAMQEHYSEKDGSFVLDIEGTGESAASLRRARDREKARAKALKEENDRLKKQLETRESGDDDESEEDDTGESDPPASKGNKQQRRKRRDIDTLQREWDDQRNELESTHNQALSKKDEIIKRTLINNQASTLAQKISTAPSLMQDAIAKRLTVEFDEETGEPSLVVLGKDGHASEMTLAALEKEFVANKEYSSIIIGSKASGSRAAQNNNAGAERTPGSAGAPVNPPNRLDKMSDKDLHAHMMSVREARAQRR